MLAAAVAAEPREPELAALAAAPGPEAAPEAPPARKTRKPPPARKARRKAVPKAVTPESPAELPPPIAAPVAAPPQGRPLFVPTVSYERQADTLHIELLDEPVSDECRSEKLNAGYTADGRLAGLQIFDVARHAAPPAPHARPLSTPDPLLAARLDKLHEELRILKTSLVLALGGLAIVLLKLF